jgi:hypothetical protein
VGGPEFKHPVQPKMKKRKKKRKEGRKKNKIRKPYL